MARHGLIGEVVVEFVCSWILVMTIQLQQNALAGLAIGFTLMSLVYMGGYVCGAVYNPAVALAAFLRGKIGVHRLVAFSLTDIVGGLCGSITGFLIRDNAAAYPVIPTIPDAGTALGVEIFFTFFLVFTILASATSSDTQGMSFYGTVIGAAVTVGAFSGGSISGGFFNPAVSIGLYVPAALWGTPNLQFGDIWISLVGPYVGAVLAFGVYWLSNPREYGRPSTVLTKALNEFVGTFMIALVMGLTAIVGHPIAGLTVGLCVMVNTYNNDHTSGGHLNPAVTLACVMRGDTPWRDGLAFVGAQTLAGILGALLAEALLPPGVLPFFPMVPAWSSVFQALIGEFVFTFFMVAVFLMTSTNSSQEGNSYFGLAIGFAAYGGMASLRKISGGVLNPAAGLGLTLIANMAGGSNATAEFVWIPIVAPLLGGALAAGFYHLVHGSIGTKKIISTDPSVAPAAAAPASAPAEP